MTHISAAASGVTKEIIAMKSAAVERVAVILCNGDVDQVITGKAHVAKEVRDLKELSDDVKVRWFDTWQQAEDFADKVRGY